jgi:LacI family transcriptional regulator
MLAPLHPVPKIAIVPGMIDADAKPLPHRATIRDVSRLAGVSIKSVSRVINNEKYVSAGTREKIEQAMAELRFQPSAAARALAGAGTQQIALICDNPSPWYIFEVMAGIRHRCELNHVRLIAQPYDRNSANLVADIASLVDQAAPDGLILTPPACDHPQLLAFLVERRVPFVRIQPGTQPDIASSVAIDNEQAAYDMTRHLLSLGHRRIGFIAGHEAYAVSGHRLSGYVRALSETGIGLNLTLVRQGDFAFETGSRAAEELLALDQPPTAIFASNDMMATGALATAHRLGIPVPGALSIAGFDDASFAPIVWPPLTTIHQPMRELAYAAADLLLERPPEPEQRVLMHALVERGSAQPLAGD